MQETLIAEKKGGDSSQMGGQPRECASRFPAASLLTTLKSDLLIENLQ